MGLHPLNDRLNQLFLLQGEFLLADVDADLLASDVHYSCLQLQVFLDRARENLDGDLLVERGTDDFEEVVELLLLVLRALRRDQVQPHVVLGLLGQVHVFHRGVGDVDLRLELGLFLGDFGDEDAHLPKDEGVVQDEVDHNQNYVQNFAVCTRAHFVAANAEESYVEAHEVLEPLCYLFFVVKA